MSIEETQRRPAVADRIHPAARADEQTKSSTRIVLAGNPNSGKTTLFNFLTGANQRVANWGGVTVEIKEGTAMAGDRRITVVDLPGTYSLSAYSMEEKLARDYLVEESPDVVVNVLDTSNLERNLYLTVQLMELGVRPILAFNMWDEVKAKGIRIDIEQLERLLDVQIVTTVGKDGKGVRELLEKAIEQKDAAAKRAGVGLTLNHLDAELADEIRHLAGSDVLGSLGRYPALWLAMKLFERDTQIEHRISAISGGVELLRRRDRAAQKIEKLLGVDTESLIAEARYGLIAGALRETLRRTGPARVEISDRIDSVLTHPFWAYPIFFAFIWLLFQATFKLGSYPMEWIDSGVGLLADGVGGIFPRIWLRDLLVDGIISGVGSVLVFLPNILILFLGISVMEDTGYMARAAFIMDRIMHRIGLHGKSFIPMLMGLGCNVPAIMAARTLESDKDRIKTILLTPLISCSARLPVYVLFAGALFPKHAGNIVFLFHFVFGFLAFFLVGIAFKHTLFRNQEEYPFVMELPPYRLPTGRSVVIHMWQKARHYLKKMGGVVLGFMVLLWFGQTFPRSPEVEARFDRQIQEVGRDYTVDRQEREERIEELRMHKRSAVMRRTAVGRIGQALEPVVRPLGFDWRGAVSLVTGFVAKEVVVASMGVLYAVGDDETEESVHLRKQIASNFSPLTGFAFMVFVLLYVPCVVALVTVIRELRNWKWSLFSFSYQLLLAWGAAFVVYQTGRMLGG